MKLNIEASEALLREGKAYFLVHFKTIISQEEYVTLLSRLQLQEVTLDYPGVFDEAAEKVVDALPEPPKPPVKEVKTWVP